MRPQTIGASANFELEYAQFDSHLQNHSTIAGADLARQVLAGLRIIRPTLDHVIQIPTHHHPPTYQWQ